MLLKRPSRRFAQFAVGIVEMPVGASDDEITDYAEKGVINTSFIHSP